MWSKVPMIPISKVWPAAFSTCFQLNFSKPLSSKRQIHPFQIRLHGRSFFNSSVSFYWWEQLHQEIQGAHFGQMTIQIDLIVYIPICPGNALNPSSSTWASKPQILLLHGSILSHKKSMRWMPRLSRISTTNLVAARWHRSTVPAKASPIQLTKPPF